MQNQLEQSQAGTPGNSWINPACAKVATDSAEPIPAAVVEAIRGIIAFYCPVPDAPLTIPHCHTSINATLLEAWRAAARDPDTEVYKWLTEGAPAGIELKPKDCGIFPTLDDSPELSAEDIATDFGTFANYSGVEGDAAAEDEISARIEQGYIKAFDTIAELTEFLSGARPVLNKIGIISKERAGAPASLIYQ